MLAVGLLGICRIKQRVLFPGHNLYWSIMLAKSKQNSPGDKSPKLKNYKSSELPPRRPLGALSRRNEQFYSEKQINHKMVRSNEHSSRRQPSRKGENFATTDESSNIQESNFQESLCFADPKKINRIEGKDKTEATWDTRRRRAKGEGKASRAWVLQGKLSQMRELVISHEMELRRLKSEMKQRELFRLLKMHSVEKMRVLEETSNIPKRPK